MTHIQTLREVQNFVIKEKKVNKIFKQKFSKTNKKN